MIAGHRYIWVYRLGEYPVFKWNPMYERYEEVASFVDGFEAREFTETMNVRERV